MLYSCENGANVSGKMSSKADSISYAIGADVFKGISKAGFDLQPAELLKGCKDGKAGNSAYADEVITRLIGSFQMQMQQKSMGQLDESKLVDIDSVSYAVGLDLHKSLSEFDINLNPDFLFLGAKEATGEGEPSISEDAQKGLITAFQQEMQAKQGEVRAKQGVENKIAGEKFMAENKAKDGIKTLASGLQYKVVSSGSGRSPKAESTVKVHYEGRLLDGSVFDSSIARGEPAEFPVNGVIKGWTEALQLMKPGDKWQLFIPSDLAYGPNGAGANIGPNAALIFDVELIEIVK